jgi:hypothetical protein
MLEKELSRLPVSHLQVPLLNNLQRYEMEQFHIREQLRRLLVLLLPEYLEIQLHLLLRRYLFHLLGLWALLVQHHQ